MSSSSRSGSNHAFKLTLIGDSGVGKTQLMARFKYHQFSEVYAATYGVNFGSKKLDVAGKEITAQVWDPSGQERYYSLISMYCRGSAALILVFDLTNLESFEKIKKLYLIFKQDAVSGVRIILVGNKSDLTDKRVVDQDAIDLLVDNKDNGISAYFPVSAKSGSNVDQMFLTTIESIMKQQGLMPSVSKTTAESKPLPDDNNNIELSSLLPNNNSSSDSPMPKDVLVARLSKYIRRIDGYLQDAKNNGHENSYGYEHGFWFFKKTRAANREANYLLAKALQKGLDKSDGSIDAIKENFRDLENMRSALFSYQTDDLFGGSGEEDAELGGIHSTELNQAIERADYFVKRQLK